MVGKQGRRRSWLENLCHRTTPGKYTLLIPSDKRLLNVLRSRKQKETFVSPQCDGISSTGLLLLLPLCYKTSSSVQLQGGIMIIKHMNEAIKEPISARHQAFKGSAWDSEIRRLNSLRTFDDRPLLTVIGGIKRRRAKLLCLMARQHIFIPANRTGRFLSFEFFCFKLTKRISPKPLSRNRFLN